MTSCTGPNRRPGTTLTHSTASTPGRRGATAGPRSGRSNPTTMNRRKFLAMLAMLAADGCGAHRPVVPLDESVYRYGVSPPVYGRRRSEPLRIVHRPDFVTVT
jgi:hypothetical protein